MFRKRQWNPKNNGLKRVRSGFEPRMDLNLNEISKFIISQSLYFFVYENGSNKFYLLQIVT
jgi:hypothetical protein